MMTENEKLIVSTLIAQMNLLIAQYDFKAIDELLVSLNMKEMFVSEIIVCCRYLFPLREKLTKYENFVLRAQSELTLRKLDVEMLLKGVYIT